jgi:hypothetical protein
MHGHGIDNARSQKFKRFNLNTYLTCAFNALSKVKRSKERKKVALHSVQLNAHDTRYIDILEQGEEKGRTSRVKLPIWLQAIVFGHNL